MNQGIYEQLVTQLITRKLESLEKENYFIKETIIDKEEAASILVQHLSTTIKYAFNLLKGESQLETQIEIANKIIYF
jgi:hypothetical protein